MGGTAKVRAISVSGTTVVIGSSAALSGTVTSAVICATLDKILVQSADSSNVYIEPFTVSGSTLTPGTSGAFSPGLLPYQNQFLFPLGSYWIAVWTVSGSQTYVAVVTLSGTTVTLSTVTLNN